LGNDQLDESKNENVESIENLDNHQLDEMMNDVVANFIHISKKFQNLGNDSNIQLFSDCTKFMKISYIFKLYNSKAKNKWNNKIFISLFQLLGEILLENSSMLDFTNMDMKVERIHVCSNDYILYRNEYNNLDKYYFDLCYKLVT
jgi:hypothetical protein